MTIGYWLKMILACFFFKRRYGKTILRIFAEAPIRFACHTYEMLCVSFRGFFVMTEPKPTFDLIHLIRFKLLFAIET